MNIHLRKFSKLTFFSQTVRITPFFTNFAHKNESKQIGYGNKH